jgi:hypothetical protein
MLLIISYWLLFIGYWLISGGNIRQHINENRKYMTRYRGAALYHPLPTTKESLPKESLPNNHLYGLVSFPAPTTTPPTPPVNGGDN